jgi:hypothetical protein
MAKTALTDQEWKEQMPKSYLTPYLQNYLPFSIEYANDYRLVMPKRTFIPQCCFFCLQGAPKDGEDASDISNQGIRTELFPDDHPMSCLYYCSNEKCKMSARISEQVHIADRRIALFTPQSAILKGKITVKRTNGDLETDWTVRHYQFHPGHKSDTNASDVGEPAHLSLYVLRSDGTRKGFLLNDFLTNNMELIKKHGLNSITPHFDEWYPPTRKAEILKLFNEAVIKSGLNL